MVLPQTMYCLEAYKTALRLCMFDKPKCTLITEALSFFFPTLRILFSLFPSSPTASTISLTGVSRPLSFKRLCQSTVRWSSPWSPTPIDPPSIESNPHGSPSNPGGPCRVLDSGDCNRPTWQCPNSFAKSRPHSGSRQHEGCISCCAKHNPTRPWCPSRLSRLCQFPFTSTTMLYCA